MNPAKTILITGATSGIGRVTTEYLANLGYRCVLVARREEIMLQMVECLSTANIEHLFYKCDLANLETISGLFDYLKEKKVILSGYVHCAGISPLMKVSENDMETMLRTFTVNYFSFIEIVKNYLNPCYSHDESSIIAISSITAQTSTFRQCIYGSSKAALNCSVKHIAKEALQREIRINAIMPGPVNTEMLREIYEKRDDYEEKMKQWAPLGVIEPLAISKYVSYLLSDDARYITGTIITIDSGLLIKA